MKCRRRSRDTSRRNHALVESNGCQGVRARSDPRRFSTVHNQTRSADYRKAVRRVRGINLIHP